MTNSIKKELISQKLKMIEEYQKIKSKESKYFKTVKEMCKFYNISQENIL